MNPDIQKNVVMTISRPVRDERYLQVPYWFGERHFTIDRRGMTYNLLVYFSAVFGLQSVHWYSPTTDFWAWAVSEFTSFAATGIFLLVIGEWVKYRKL